LQSEHYKLVYAEDENATFSTISSPAEVFVVAPKKQLIIYYCDNSCTLIDYAAQVERAS
jgi:hypothetical protein